MAEDRVETTHQDQRLGRLVPPRQHGPGGLAGGWDPAMNGGATWCRRGPQEDRQQDEELVEAQAQGQGRHSELVWLGQGALHGLEQPVPALGVLPAAGFILLDQWLTGGSAAVLGLPSGQDLRGRIGDALAAAAGLLGRRSDGTVRTEETGRGMGDPTDEGYGAQGDGSSGVCVRSRTAPMRSILQRIKRVLVESCQVAT